MKVSRSRLSSVVASKLAAAKSPKAIAEETAAYLISERRVSELDSLLRDIQQYRADHGQVEVEAVSAFPLSAVVRDDIEQKIKAAYPEAKRIVITERIDETVVGGVRLELAQQQLDVSIRNKLNQFKQLTEARS